MSYELETIREDYTLACDRATMTASLDFLRADSQALADMVCDYLEVASKTRQAYRKNIRYFFSFLQERGISHPSSATVKSYKQSLLDAGKAVATINLAIAPLRKLFQFLAACGKYPDITYGLKKEKDSQDFKRLPLSRNQMKELIDENIDGSSLKELRDHAIISVLLFSGLRSVSVRELRVCDLAKMGETSVLYYRNKGQRERASIIAISQGCSDAIQAYLDARKAEGKELDQSSPLFLSMGHNGGHQLSEYGFRQIVNERLQAHGLKTSKVTVHSLRHSNATALLQAGLSVLEVSQALNHKNITTTQRYVHLAESMEHSPSSRLENFLNS